MIWFGQQAIDATGKDNSTIDLACNPLLGKRLSQEVTKLNVQMKR